MASRCCCRLGSNPPTEGSPRATNPRRRLRRSARPRGLRRIVRGPRPSVQHVALDRDEADPERSQLLQSAWDQRRTVQQGAGRELPLRYVGRSVCDRRHELQHDQVQPGLRRRTTRSRSSSIPRTRITCSPARTTITTASTTRRGPGRRSFRPGSSRRSTAARPGSTARSRCVRATAPVTRPRRSTRSTTSR